MNDPVNITRGTYDAVAGAFLENTRDRSAMRVWMERFTASLAPGTLVLDLGAGPGFDAAELRRQGFKAIAADLSLGMLKSGVREFPAPRAQADLRHLPFRSESVCGIWANASLLHLSRAEASLAFQEIGRVLQPPGVFHLAVKQGSGTEWESDRYGSPRWFQYWSDSDLDAELDVASFCVGGAWVYETARATWLVRLAHLRRGVPSGGSR